MADTQLYLVSYDVTDDKRRRKVFKTLLGFGEHAQYSVFLCTLTPAGFVRLRARLHDLLHHREDRILFADLGPSEGRGRRALTSLGLPPEPPTTDSVIF